MVQPKVEELIQKAATSEQYFTTLPTETRIEMIAILVVDRILADLENGRFLLKELKEGEKNSHEHKPKE